MSIKKGASNRAAVTVRFNLEEQEHLRALMKQFNAEAPRALKICFWQMIEFLKTVQKEKEKENESNSIPAIRPGTVDNSVAGDNGSVAVAVSAEDAGSGDAAAAPAA